MIGMMAQGINAAYITKIGGYHLYFQTQHLDRSIGLMGYGFLAWYVVAWLSWFKVRKAAA